MGSKARLALVWLFACWGGWALAVEAERQDPAEWLRAMVESMQRLDYRATLAYSRDNRIQTLRLVHNVKDGVVRERLQALNDPLREVVREANKVTCYFPERRTVVVESQDFSPASLLGEWSTQWLGEAKFYRLALGRKGQVAERSAREILIEPVDAYRYGRRVWIDEESKLPLQLEVVDAEDNVLEAFVVTELVLGYVDKQARKESKSHTGTESWKVLDRMDVPADRHWQLSQLPQGFVEVKRSRHQDPASSSPVDHILITDGLASVSVYIKRQDENSQLESAHRRVGAVNVYNRLIDGYLVTVLGDVPPETVRLIGDGVRQADPKLP
ncbi:MucB/RseB C-terminal domain-containing protein [Methylothermus subterraneus]